jgi:hypothetical protein
MVYGLRWNKYHGMYEQAFGLAFAWLAFDIGKGGEATLLNHTLYNNIRIENGKSRSRNMKSNGMGIAQKGQEVSKHVFITVSDSIFHFTFHTFSDQSRAN